MKPLMNLDEAVFDDIEDNGYYTSRRATIGDHIGAKKLGYNLTVLPPGKAQCPFRPLSPDTTQSLPAAAGTASSSPGWVACCSHLWCRSRC